MLNFTRCSFSFWCQRWNYLEHCLDDEAGLFRAWCHLLCPRWRLRLYQHHPGWLDKYEYRFGHRHNYYDWKVDSRSCYRGSQNVNLRFKQYNSDLHNTCYHIHNWAQAIHLALHSWFPAHAQINQTAGWATWQGNGGKNVRLRLNKAVNKTTKWWKNSWQWSHESISSQLKA